MPNAVILKQASSKRPIKLSIRNDSSPDQPLIGWHAIVLRPAATRAPLLKCLRRAGATPLPLPVMHLAPAPNREAAAVVLAQALAADVVVFTSPAAVRFSIVLPTWHAVHDRAVIAIGNGTATALSRQGIRHVITPSEHQTSEGVLALPVLVDAEGKTIGLITAPDGRGLLESTLARRGARLVRADVYRRTPGRLNRRHYRSLGEMAGPCALLLSSGQALDFLLADTHPAVRQTLESAAIIAASERLAGTAAAAGLKVAAIAASAKTEALVAALIGYAQKQGIPVG